METISIYLSSNELQALKMFSEERSSAAIKRDCAPALSSSAFVAFCVGTKRKTGIRDLRNAEEVKSYLFWVDQALKMEPTLAQLELLRRILGIGFPDHTFESLANRLQITPKEAQQRYQEALHAIGIFATDERMQRVQARLFFASRPPTVTPVTPPGKLHWEVLRLYSEGLRAEDIAMRMEQRLPFVQMLIKQACERLGITARGRGVQRKLAKLAIEQHEGKKAALMDDPAF